MSNQKPARQIAREQLHNPTEWETKSEDYPANPPQV